jgi:hypothetical protein
MVLLSALLFSQVLPLGASKGAGVSWLLDHLGMDPAGLLALGDGENDMKLCCLAFTQTLPHNRLMFDCVHGVVVCRSCSWVPARARVCPDWSLSCERNPQA